LNRDFAIRLAWREGRAGLRRIGVYLASITLGVGALVAIHSFRSDVDRAIRLESRTLLGGDLRLESQAPFPDAVESLLDSLAGAGSTSARATTLITMVGSPLTDRTRLLQARGVTAGFPLYGSVVSAPEGAWDALPDGGFLVADPAVLVQLGVEVGDTLQVGELRLPLAGTVDGLPADVGFQTAVGPRVYLAESDLRATGLLGFGSLARYQVLLRLPEGEDPSGVVQRYRTSLREAGVSTQTARGQAEDLSDALEVLSRLLGLVGLVAILLGGIGVASAIHVFVRERLTGVAVLRCLGARQGTVFGAYLLQAGGLGVLGSGAGVLLGLGIQALLPALLRDFLPVAVRTSPDPAAMAAGLIVGVWVSVAFALLPLLAVRDVPPLRALRQDVEGGSRRGDPLRLGAVAALALSLLLLSVWQAPEPVVGVVFAGSLAVVVGLLWLAALVLVRTTRGLIPSRVAYPVRQGISNLHRPRNQTVTVTLALGFGTFLLATIGLVERNLAARFRLEVDAAAPNTVLFDIQPDQRAGVEALLARAGAPDTELTPIVPARIAGINGRPTEELVRDTLPGRPSRWALRRVYRNTFQDALRPSDEVVAGTWWTADAGAPADGIPRISMESELASDLRVLVGDRITWDIQGVEVETRIASLRLVDWARLETNFFVVFEPGVLDDAPQTLVALARLPEWDDGSFVLQRGLLDDFPNVSLVDLGQLRETVDRILGTVSRAIRILALLTVAGGVLVLAGALATSRYQRMREGALLRTLGARRGALRMVFLTEYAALGVLAALAGGILGIVSAGLVVTRVFELPFHLPLGVAVGVPAGVVALTLLLGVMNSGGLLTRPPLPVLREIAE
jgi:putative ABC transport system permease protein